MEQCQNFPINILEWILQKKSDKNMKKQKGLVQKYQFFFMCEKLLDTSTKSDYNRSSTKSDLMQAVK